MVGPLAAPLSFPRKRESNFFESAVMKAWMTYNPNCGTARNVLALLRERGIEPEIVEYLKTPLARDQIAALVQQMGVKGEPGSSERSGAPFAPANAAGARDQARSEAGGAAIKVADIVRWKEVEAVAAAGVTPDSTDDALLDALATHPVLLNRPIVVTEKGAKLCRPSDALLEVI